MLSNAPVINLMAPFFAAFVICGVGLWKRGFAQPIAVVGLAVSLASAVATLLHVAADGPISYAVGGWAAPYGIVLGIDLLNALVVVLIHLVALLSAIHAGPAIARDLGEKQTAYYTLFLLFVTGVTGITETADAFNLYVLIEVASLTSYALIAVGDKRSVHAALNYLLMGSIGATLYLLGVGYLYIKTGTLNMHDIHAVLVAQDLFASPTVQVAAIMIFIGLALKMALFPFHGWLPNAYTWSPPSTASLLGSLMTKVMIYVMVRMMLVVFGVEAVFGGVAWAQAIPYLAIVAIFYGSLMALGQRSLRRVIAYIIVAEVGYMVGAAWLGNEKGLTGAFFHLISDSLMTLCLFLAAGSLMFRHGIQKIDQLEGAFRRMPVTMTCFAVGAFSMIGIPPTCGFFSKWYLLSGGFDAGNWLYVGALLFSSFVNAVIFFRIFEIACFGKHPQEAGHGHDDDHGHDGAGESVVVRRAEAPLLMLIPAFAVAASILLLGIFNQRFVEMIQTTIGLLSQGGLPQ